MSLSVVFETFGGKAVLFVSGRIDSATAADFEAALFDAFGQADDGGLTVECSALEYISSAGLRVLLMGAKRQRKAKLGYALCALSDNIRKVFTMGGFEKLIPIYAKLDDVP
jgi:anti-anti-sigma factor